MAVIIYLRLKGNHPAMRAIKLSVLVTIIICICACTKKNPDEKDWEIISTNSSYFTKGSHTLTDDINMSEILIAHMRTFPACKHAEAFTWSICDHGTYTYWCEEYVHLFPK